MQNWKSYTTQNARDQRVVGEMITELKMITDNVRDFTCKTKLQLQKLQIKFKERNKLCSSYEETFDWMKNYGKMPWLYKTCLIKYNILRKWLYFGHLFHYYISEGHLEKYIFKVIFSLHIRDYTNPNVCCLCFVYYLGIFILTHQIVLTLLGMHNKES